MTRHSVTTLDIRLAMTGDAERLGDHITSVLIPTVITNIHKDLYAFVY